MNPLRYRGYVFDDETGLYYLQSRYYDPVTGRFINADVYADTGSGSPLSTNMFAYCENNYLYRLDKNGQDAAWIQAPDSASNWFFNSGHTAVLLQQSPNYWFYFSWSGESIQLIFLPPSSLQQVNTRVSVVEFFFRMIFAIDINSEDIYRQSMLFKGNFTQSIIAARELMKKIANKYHKHIYKLRVNPDLKKNYGTYYYAHHKNECLTYINTKYNTLYLGSTRPESWIISGNEDYMLLWKNCMHMSVQLLGYGRLNNNDRQFHSLLDEIYQKTVPAIPNNAYKKMRDSKLHTTEWVL